MQRRVPLDKVVWIAKYETAGGRRFSQISGNSASRKPTPSQKSSCPPQRSVHRRNSDPTSWPTKSFELLNKDRVRAPSAQPRTQVSGDIREKANTSTGYNEWTPVPSVESGLVKKTSDTIQVSVQDMVSSSSRRSLSCKEDASSSMRISSASTSQGVKSSRMKGQRVLSIDCATLFANETWYKKGRKYLSNRRSYLADVFNDNTDDLEMMCERLCNPTASSRARQVVQRHRRSASSRDHVSSTENNSNSFVLDPHRVTGSRSVGEREMKASVARPSQGRSPDVFIRKTPRDFTAINNSGWMKIESFAE